jgi:hypothetical protein
MEDVTVQPRAHLAIGRQWKSRSVLLLPNFSREKVSLSPLIPFHVFLIDFFK